MITALLATLYDNRNAEGVEELRKIFSNDFRKRLMMTDTGITYRAEASDLVMHDSGMSEQTTLEARLVGPDGYINGSMSEEMRVLLGNSDVDKVRAVYKWVTGMESYLWRLNKQPKQNEERALVLGYNGFNYVFYIVAGGSIYIYGYGPARGVRIAPQNSTGSKGNSLVS